MINLRNLILIFLVFILTKSKGEDIIVLHDSLPAFEVSDRYKAVYIDHSNELNLKQVISKNSFSNEFNGYTDPTDATFWIRFKVDAKTENHRKWILEVLDSRHNLITLFVPKSNDKLDYQHFESGLDHGFSNRLYHHKNIVLDIDIEPGSNRYYYLKLKS